MNDNLRIWSERRILSPCLFKDEFVDCYYSLKVYHQYSSKVYQCTGSAKNGISDKKR